MAPARDVGEVESDDTTIITRRQRTALMQAVTLHLEEALALREALGGTPENFAMWQVGDKEPRLADVFSSRYASTVARIFNEETGYDFRRRADRRKFMDELIKDKPHEV